MGRNTSIISVKMSILRGKTKKAKKERNVQAKNTHKNEKFLRLNFGNC